MTSNIQIRYNINLYGAAGCGKTSIIRRYVNGIFDPTCQPTVGLHYIIKQVSIDANIIELQLNDTAGQEQFRSLVELYYRNANGMLLVFDVTDQKSFDELPEWLEKINNNKKEDAQILLIGNKIDLDCVRVISTETANKFAYNNNLEYYEVSALTGANINDIFTKLAQMIYLANSKHEIMNESIIDIEEKPNQKCC